MNQYITIYMTYICIYIYICRPPGPRITPLWPSSGASTAAAEGRAQRTNLS